MPSFAMRFNSSGLTISRSVITCLASLSPLISRQISPELESVTDLMYALIRLVAERSGVATSVIASRDDLNIFFYKHYCP